MSAHSGLCRHCGLVDAPVTSDGYIDRHWRADRKAPDPGNVLCAGSAMGEGHLRPGELCQHPTPNKFCIDAPASLAPTQETKP